MPGIPNNILLSLCFPRVEPLGDPPLVANLVTAVVLVIVIFFQAIFTAHQVSLSGFLLLCKTSFVGLLLLLLPPDRIGPATR